MQVCITKGFKVQACSSVTYDEHYAPPHLFLTSHVKCYFTCYSIFLLSGYVSCVWNVEENKNLALQLAYWHWDLLFSSLYMSATQIPFSNFPSKLCQFNFLDALVLERHGLYTNRKRQNQTFFLKIKTFPWIDAKCFCKCCWGQSCQK